MENTKSKNDNYSMGKNRRYVSLTPYLRLDDNRRHRANIYTTMSYKADEILKKIDNDAAIAFIEKAAQRFEKRCEQGNQIPIVIEFRCELSFFVDERTRIEKGYLAKSEGDILSGINCLTIYSPEYDLINDARRTFVVDLDRLGESLNALGYTTEFEDYSSEYIKGSVLKHGFGTTPSLDFTKNYQKGLNLKQLNL